MMIVERDASGLFVINYWQTNQVTNNGGGGGRREWASLNTAKICRNSKLAKAETIPAQMRSCSSQGRRKTRAVRRVVMDRQLIDKLVERKTKFTPHPFFFLSVFGLFSSSWSCVIRLENIAKLASKKNKTNEFEICFYPSTRHIDTVTTNKGQSVWKRQRERCGRDWRREWLAFASARRERVRPTDVPTSPKSLRVGWMERREGERRERTKKERKKMKERWEREHVNNIPQLLSAKAIAVVCCARSGIERTEDFTICIEGEWERERERKLLAAHNNSACAQSLHRLVWSFCLPW